MDDLIQLIQKHCHSNKETLDKVVPAIKKLEKANSTKNSSSSASTSATTSTTTSTTTTSTTSPTNVLESSLKNGNDPLNELTPEQHSIGYLLILNARCGANFDPTYLLPLILNFTERFNPDSLRFVPEHVNFFVKQFTGLAASSNFSASALQPLKNIIQRYLTPGTLTNMHTLFVQIVMECRSYELARDVLMQEITEIDPQTFPIKYMDNLLYHYLGGVILALLGEYDRSIEMLEICVSAPGSGVSAVQIDAYKKLVLIQLIANGRASAIPKYTTSSASSAYKNSAGPYNEIAIAFGNLNKYNLLSLLDKHREVFERDYNAGLIYLCQTAFRRKQIQNLTEIYITLSMVDIASLLEFPLTDEGFRAVEKEVSYLISTSKIYGSISHPPAIILASGDMGIDYAAVTVTFKDDPEPYNTLDTVARLKYVINKTARRENELIYLDKGMAINRDFVTKAYNNASANNASQSSSGLMIDDLDSGMTPDYEGEE